MKSARWRFAALLLPLVAGCTYYGGISKTTDGKVYLTGYTNYLIFASSFVRKCTESGNTLTCTELNVTDGGASGGGGDKDDDDSAPAKPKKKKKPADDDN